MYIRCDVASPFLVVNFILCLFMCGDIVYFSDGCVAMVGCVCVKGNVYMSLDILPLSGE